MTEPELVAKKLAEIERYVRELRTLARPEEMMDDVREERFVTHTLQLAVQAALDVASHIVSDDRLGEPQTYRELFEILARNDWIDSELGTNLGRMAGFRNLLVHDYAAIDLGIVRNIVEHHLGDFLAYVESIRRALRESG